MIFLLFRIRSYFCLQIKRDICKCNKKEKNKALEMEKRTTNVYCALLFTAQYKNSW